MSSSYLLDRGTIGSDLLAGLTSALVYIPKGMAFALVAGHTAGSRVHIGGKGQ